MDSAYGQMHVIYRWKSVYIFSPNLAKQLVRTVETEEVKCEFDAVGQAFVFDGPRHKIMQALENVQKAVNKAYEHSVIGARNLGYIPLIQRSRLSEFNSVPITWKEDIEVDHPDDIIPQVIGVFSMVKTWSPKTGSDFARILHPQDIDDDIPTMIERVCDCQIDKDIFQRKLHIRANDPYVIGRVIQKLDKVEEIFNSVLYPKTAHLVYVQDKAPFELKLVALKAQSWTTGKTTLFGEKHRRYYQDRKSIYSLRVLRRKAEGDRPTVVPLEIKQIPGDRTVDGPRAWIGYLYKGFGAYENNPAVYVKPIAKLDYNQVPSIDLQNHANTLSRALGNLLDTDGFDLGPRPTFEIDREDETTDFLSGPRPTFGEVDTNESVLPVVAKRRVREFQEGLAATSYPEQANAHPAPTNTVVNENLDFFADRPRPPTITSSGMVRTTRRVRAAPPSPPEEKEQTVAEHETRMLRNVSAQKKNTKRKDNKQYDPTEHEKFNMEKMRDVFELGLDYARQYKCRPVFEARIGRIIYGSAPPASKCMTWDEFSPILEDRQDTMKTIFTDRITTDSVDVDFICDLKLKESQNLFNFEPDKKNIWYEFQCDYKDKPCIVIVNAETKEMEVLGRLETYGTVFWNCPMRSWDARFCLKARKVLNNEEAAFRLLAESIFVPDDGVHPEISFKTESKNLIVKKVYCKREARYLVLPSSLTGPHRNFEFCATEVQDLWLHRHLSSDETYKANTYNSESRVSGREDMIANGRLHYAFSLVPSKMDETFEAQANLEVGEVAQWTGSSILGSGNDGVIEAMTKIVSAVIERIDNVGFGNQGHWED